MHTIFNSLTLFFEIQSLPEPEFAARLGQVESEALRNTYLCPIKFSLLLGIQTQDCMFVQQFFFTVSSLQPKTENNYFIGNRVLHFSCLNQVKARRENCSILAPILNLVLVVDKYETSRNRRKEFYDIYAIYLFHRGNRNLL